MVFLKFIFLTYLVSMVAADVSISEVKGVAPKVTLNDGRKMPALALGTWLGYSAEGTRNRPKNREVEEAVEWALDAGYRHIDTAYIYRIEDQVGSALAHRLRDGNLTRDDIFVTTKLWNEFHAEDQVMPALRNSLNSLGLDYVDLYLIHWPVGQFNNGTYDTTDYIETWRGMEGVRRAGLARSIGLSNFNRDQIERVLEVAEVKPAVLQVELNLNLQQAELLAYCRQQGIAVMGYTPFGSLFPSRAREDAPPPRVDDPQLVTIAGKYNKTVPQVVLRYLVELGVVPIPKSITEDRIQQNIDIFDFELTEDERQLLKSFDKNYRVIPQLKWKDHPYFPF